MLLQISLFIFMCLRKLIYRVCFEIEFASEYA